MILLVFFIGIAIGLILSRFFQNDVTTPKGSGMGGGETNEGPDNVNKTK